MFKNPIGFLNQDSIPALTTHKCLKNIKVAPDTHRQNDPVLEHFGAVTVAISRNFRVPVLNCNCSGADPLPEPVPMAVYGVLLDLHVSKSSA